MNDTDSQRGLERSAIIAVKESDLERIEIELVMAFNHYQAMRKMASQTRPNQRDEMILRSIRDLRAVMEDLLLSIRLTENELHDLHAPGWTN